jgi:hypothetical protein
MAERRNVVTARVVSWPQGFGICVRVGGRGWSWITCEAGSGIGGMTADFFPYDINERDDNRRNVFDAEDLSVYLSYAVTLAARGLR